MITLDQNLVQLFFTVANCVVPLVFDKLVDYLKSKSEYDTCIEVVSNLIKVNVSAANDTIQKALIEASSDNKITDDEFSQIKELVVKSVKKNLTQSIMDVLKKNISDVDKYINDEVESAMKAPDEVLELPLMLETCLPQS